MQCPRCGSKKVRLVETPIHIMDYLYHYRCSSCGNKGRKKLTIEKAGDGWRGDDDKPGQQNDKADEPVAT